MYAAKFYVFNECTMDVLLNVWDSPRNVANFELNYNTEILKRKLG
jgi:hypothetical protein